MRKGVAVLMLAGSFAFPASAAADKEIVAVSGDAFSPSTVTMDQGEPLNFRNSDALKKHDVVSTDIVDGKPLFRAELISQGTTFVEGSQYLKTGTYQFICSVHNGMDGTLNVSTAGTPQQRPGTGTGGGGGTTTPTGDTTAPAVSLNVGTMLQASKLKKARKLIAKVGSDEAGKVRVTIKLGKRVIGRAAGTIAAGATKRVTIPLGRTARGLLKKGRKLEITATVTDASGNVGTAETKAPLR